MSDETLNMAVDRLAVNLGKELVGLIDGRVITEVDILGSVMIRTRVWNEVCGTYV